MRLSLLPVMSFTAGGIGVSCFLSLLPLSVHGAAVYLLENPHREANPKLG